MTRVGRRRSLRRSASAALADGNVRQAIVTLSVAVLVAAATAVSGVANDHWASSVRAETRWSAAAVETLRHLYAREAPVAFDVALAEVRARALDDAAAAAAGDDGIRARFEGEVEGQVSWHLRRSLEDTDSLLNVAYALPGGGFDVAARLADLQDREGDLLAEDPARTVAAGDRARVVAEALAALTLPTVLLYITVELVLAARSSRGRRGTARPGSLWRQGATASGDDADLVPRPWAVDGRRRPAVVVAFAAWFLVAILPFAQLHAAHVASRAGSESSRAAATVSALIAGGQQRQSFLLDVEGALLTDLSLRSVAREWATAVVPGTLADAEAVVTAADAAALAGMRAITAEMTRLPGTADGVDARLADLAGADLDAASAVQQDQGNLLDQADHAQSRANRFAVALLLATLCLSMAALATTRVGQRPIVRLAPAALRAGSFVLSLRAVVG